MADERGTGGKPSSRFSSAAGGVAEKVKDVIASLTSSQDKDKDKEEGDDIAGAIKGALFLVAVILVYVVYLTVTGQTAQIIDALSKVKTGWVLGALACYGVYFLLGVASYAVAVWFDRDSPAGLLDLISVCAASIFFGNLTPGASGAGPAEIVRLTRTGLDAEEAFATQFTKFFVFQLAQVIFMGTALAIGFPVYYRTHGAIIFVDLICFIANCFQFLIPLAVCLKPMVVMRVGNSAIKFLSKRGFLRNYGHWYNLVNRQTAEFAKAFRSMIGHPHGLIAILALLVAQMVVLAAVPWFVLRAFGRKAALPAVILAGAMVQMFSNAVPLPGGTGGAEAGFALFFGKMFGPFVSAGFVVWRIVCYFAPTIIMPTMLGLRSGGKQSLYQRWNTLTKVSGERRVDGVRVKPAQRPSWTERHKRQRGGGHRRSR
ncbi:MAG: flippase-like domain-containing protein [Atopobiaceae bacterium]|nr:flippase-like domain-containing protein [Atopobiaceae bacterium]